MHSASIQSYLDELRQRGKWPRGFQGYTSTITFVPSERPSLEPYRMNLALVQADKAVTSFAGVFTRNQFPGAPVIIGREMLKQQSVAGVLINNRISNVCSPTGLSDIRSLQESLSELTGFPARDYFCVSTGIIGWSLPLPEMQQALPGMLENPADPLEVAQAIMTTDTYPKLRAVHCDEGSILGIVKGAGMIEPNMATMLVFLFTDLQVRREDVQSAMSSAAELSFNRISVDSDQSTSDMALLFSSGMGGKVDADKFTDMLTRLCSDLAQDIVRNGEGVSHVIQVEVRGARSADEARGCGKAIVNSPLVKTAVYGNDPNVGRIVAALGDYCGNNSIEIDPLKVRIEVEGLTVFTEGAFRLSLSVEKELADRLANAAMNPRITGFPQNDDCVRIVIDLGMGSASDTVYGADLSHEYVTENADYRT